MVTGRRLAVKQHRDEHLPVQPRRDRRLPVAGPPPRLWWHTTDVVWPITILLGLLILGSAVAVLVAREATLAVVGPQAWAGIETASASARLFGALVLLLFPAHHASRRFHWLAGGFIILAVGGLVFGYLVRLLDASPGLNTSMYGATIVWTFAGVFFVIGLLPRTPPRLSPAAVASAVVTFGVLVVGVLVRAGQLPRLVTTDDVVVTSRYASPLATVTAWHWLLASLPLLLAVVALVGTARHHRAGLLGGWLVVATTLLLGSQLHNLLWPSAFTPVLTPANLLRLAFAAVVVIGGILELRRIAAVREAQSQRLAELARLKADFTSMVAHELASPVAAIRGYADMLAIPELQDDVRARAATAIQQETLLLDALVADVRSSATVEREDFQVHLRSVPLEQLLEDAAQFARTLPGEHPLTVAGTVAVIVRADRERIGQVLRNLLSNAAKYTPDGTPINLRATREGRGVRVEVIDEGPGIHPDDLARIFEKFGRGRDARGRHVAGVGLGLYLSQGIIRAHGSRLTVTSTPGHGAAFGFTLEAA